MGRAAAAVVAVAVAEARHAKRPTCKATFFDQPQEASFDEPRDVPSDVGREVQASLLQENETGMSNARTVESPTHGDRRPRAEPIDEPTVEETKAAWAPEPRIEPRMEPVPAPRPQPQPQPAVASSTQRAATPSVESFVLPAESLRGVAENAGLTWVTTDVDKVRAAQDAMAHEPKPVHAPRAPRAPVVADDGPLTLVETKKDLSGWFDAR